MGGFPQLVCLDIACCGGVAVTDGFVVWYLLLVYFGCAGFDLFCLCGDFEFELGDFILWCYVIELFVIL